VKRLVLPWVPMGSQVRAVAEKRRQTCICDPRFLGVAHDVECPVHGVPAIAARRETAA
jgi:stringent starvation protein B